MQTVTAREQRVVLPGSDLDAVGTANPEPLLRDLGDLLPVTLDLVLVVDDVALCRHVPAALDVDRVAVADPHQRLLHGLRVIEASQR
jgi:hypothetical protein